MKQYCRVGKMKALSGEPKSLETLHVRYSDFIERATENNADERMADFFASKIRGFKKMIEELSAQ